MEKQASNKRRNQSAFLAYCLLTLVVVGIAIGGISAKYFRELDEETGIVTARDFYFESDLLSDNSPVYYLAAGTQSVSFELRNYVDSLRWAEDDIQFEITVLDEGENATDATITVEPSNAEGEIVSGAKNKVTVTIGNMQDGETYVVTATGSAGYVKTLEATFVVDTANKVYKHISTSGPQVILTVWTENVSGEASFTIPAGLIPNVTESPELSTVNNYDETDGDDDGYRYEEYNFTDIDDFAPYSTKAYYFIKEKPTSTYTLGQFDKVSVGTSEAIAATP